ncbi:Hypothetical predicted protein [Lecanosticta acicola]|uniref:Uncharacterized protein n=1 Tax=Lecanosticta acicola TaxID=111012 RepID=A0AAI8Z8I4_9PEZI|nr:Hypothetical predicted protein [Lecanosticta acicola]
MAYNAASATLPEAITTNEPNKMYCNLSHVDMQTGQKKICWDIPTKNKIVQFCAAHDVSHHCLPAPMTMMKLLQYIGWDTKDEDALFNATTKVCTFIIGNVTPVKMAGVLAEQSLTGARMSAWKNRWSAFSKTWMHDQYDVYGSGMSPEGVDNTMTEWKSGEWRSKDVCVNQTVAWKKANPNVNLLELTGANPAVVTSTTSTPGIQSSGVSSSGASPGNQPSGMPSAAATSSAASANLNRLVEVEKIVEVPVQSSFHRRIVDQMLEANPDWTAARMDEWINTPEGVDSLHNIFRNGLEQDNDADANSNVRMNDLQDRLRTGEQSFNIQLKDTKLQYENDIRVLREQLHKATNNSDRLQQEVLVASSRSNDQHSGQILRLGDEIRIKSSEIARLQQAVEDAKNNTNHQYEDQIRAKNSEIVRLEQAVNDARNSTNYQYEDEIRRLKDQLQDKDNIILRATQEDVTEQGKIQNQLQQAQIQLDEQTKAYGALHDYTEAACSKNKELQKQVDELKEKLAATRGIYDGPSFTPGNFPNIISHGNGGSTGLGFNGYNGYGYERQGTVEIPSPSPSASTVREPSFPQQQQQQQPPYPQPPIPGPGKSVKFQSSILRGPSPGYGGGGVARAVDPNPNNIPGYYSLGGGAGAAGPRNTNNNNDVDGGRGDESYSAATPRYPSRSFASGIPSGPPPPPPAVPRSQSQQQQQQQSGASSGFTNFLSRFSKHNNHNNNNAAPAGDSINTNTNTNVGTAASAPASAPGTTTTRSLLADMDAIARAAGAPV